MQSNNDPSTREVATLAGGCFWCLEAVYDELKGVESVESGYMGGAVVNPTYEQVCGGDTGHGEDRTDARDRIARSQQYHRS